MANAQSIVAATIIPLAENYFIVLCSQIFAARDMADVDNQITTAIKVMYGLEALTYAFPQSINAQQTQQILVTLNAICPHSLPVYQPDF